MILEGEIKEAKMRIAVPIPVLYELSISLCVCEGFLFLVRKDDIDDVLPCYVNDRSSSVFLALLPVFDQTR